MFMQGFTKNRHKVTLMSSVWRRRHFENDIDEWRSLCHLPMDASPLLFTRWNSENTSLSDVFQERVAFGKFWYLLTSMMKFLIDRWLWEHINCELAIITKKQRVAYKLFVDLKYWAPPPPGMYGFASARTNRSMPLDNDVVWDRNTPITANPSKEEAASKVGGTLASPMSWV